MSKKEKIYIPFVIKDMKNGSQLTCDNPVRLWSYSFLYKPCYYYSLFFPIKREKFELMDQRLTFCHGGVCLPCVSWVL